MQAIIFANRTGDELAPLNSHYCPALLPVGNKAVIEYTLEDIVKSGITQIKLVISFQAKEIENHLGHGEKWGLDIEYFLSKPEEDTGEILKRLALAPDESLLLVRGDIFRSPCIAHFIDFSKEFSNDFVQAKMENQNAGMMLLPAALPYIADINWPFLPHCDNKSVVTLVLHGRCFMLDSFLCYMNANKALATNELPSLTPNERSYLSASPEQDFYVGPKTNTDELHKQSGWGIIGENCQIEEDVQLKGCVVIGQNCLIDKTSIIDNSMILANTYVGGNLEVSNSILCKNLLINVETSGVIQINDQALIGSNEVQAKSSTNKTGIMTRFMLSIILLLSLPLWPLLSIYSSLRNTFKPHSDSNAEKSTISDIFIDNSGRNFQAWRWNIPSKLLSRSPQIFYVLTGKLDLFGDAPEARYSTGKEDRRLGIFGPVQLLLEPSAPEEERHMLELEFDADERAIKYLHLVCRACKSNAQVIASSL